MELSIVIPVWNEAGKIARDISNLNEYLTVHHIKAEIILSDDGSTDNTIFVAESQKLSPEISLRIERSAQHHGKGFAIRRGVLASKAPFIMFMDSGSNVPLEYIQTGLNLLQSGQCEIAHGSRHLPGSTINKDLIWYRKIYSILFRRLSRFILQIPREISDTQCGFKLYLGDVARTLYASSEVDGFLFDVEIFLLARQAGYRIREFPISWTSDRDTRLSIGHTIFPVIRQLARLRNRFRGK